MENKINTSNARDIRVKLENFLSLSVQNGLAHSWDPSSKSWIKPYPEVTGYLLSYFANIEDSKFDFESVINRLISLQNPDGSWSTFYGDISRGFTFDTTQILHGLISASNKVKNSKIDNSVTLAINFLNSRFRFGMPFSRSGKVPTILNKFDSQNWAHGFTPINFKMAELSLLPQLRDYEKGAELSTRLFRMKKWAKFQPQIRESHPGSYQLEGMYALGLKDLVFSRLIRYFKPPENEQIFAKPNVQYFYNSGNAQLAILWAKSGNLEMALGIYDTLVRRLEFWDDEILCLKQYHGLNPPHKEYSTWGIKYLCELIRILEQN